MKIKNVMARLIYREFGQGYPPVPWGKISAQDRERYIDMAGKLIKAYKRKGGLN